MVVMAWRRIVGSLEILRGSGALSTTLLHAGVRCLVSKLTQSKYHFTEFVMLSNAAIIFHHEHI